jgi:hypothetical protein
LASRQIPSYREQIDSGARRNGIVIAKHRYIKVVIEGACMAAVVYGRVGDTDWQTIVERDVNWLCIRNEGQCNHAYYEQHSVLDQFHISPYFIKTGKRQDTIKATTKRTTSRTNSYNQLLAKLVS